MRPSRLLAALVVVAALVATWLVLRTDTPRTAVPGAEGAKVDETPSHTDRPQIPQDRAPGPAAPVAGSRSAIAGTVTTSDGSPAPFADVLVLRDGLAVRAGKTSESGHFRLEGLGPGTYAVRATREGLASDTAAVALDGARPREDVRLTLEPGATLVGTVRDAADGLSLATCTAAHAGGTAVCDRGGRFTIGPLAPGEVRLRLSAPGYAPREVSARLPKRERTFVDVALSRGSVVRGHVKGPENEAVPSAIVSTRHYVLGAKEVAETATETGPDGAFVLDGVAPGRVTVVAAKRGFAESTVELRLEGGAAKEGVELVLSTGGAAAGVVETAAGAPVAGATVEALRTGDGARAGADTSAADGSFRIDGLSAGDYTFVASLGSARAIAAGVRVQDRDEADVRLALGDERVSGIVHDRAGKPVSGALVTAFSSHALASGGSMATTGDDGRFAIDGLVGAPYRVEARAPGLGAAEVRGVMGGGEVELVVGRTGTLNVNVRSHSGAPAEDVSLAIVPDGPTDGALADRYARAQVLTPDGVAVRELPAGRYVVRAVSASSGRATGWAEVREGATSEVVLVLPAGVTVSGKVTTPAGPGEGCRVLAAPLEDQFPGDGAMGSRDTLADATGAYRLDQVSAGPVLVKALCPDGTTAWRRIDPEAGGRLDVPLRTVPGPKRESTEFGGIGASLGKGPEGQVAVTAVAEGGPAFLAGVVVGDALVAVDGWSTQGADLATVVARVRGPAGSPVQLDLRRADGRSWRTIAERARIVLP